MQKFQVRNPAGSKDTEIIPEKKKESAVILYLTALKRKYQL